MSRVSLTYIQKIVCSSWVLILLGCTQGADTPPEIRADRIGCTRCRMLISDTRFAAALKTDHYLLFDDIGCMLDYSRTHSITHEASLWVRDFEQDTWIRAEEATFYMKEDKKTPMGYGYIGVAKKSSGTLLAHEAQIGTLQDLQNKFAER